jgi:hypothetical protein
MTLLGKSEGKMIIGRPRVSWVGNTNVDLQEIVWGTVDWIDMASVNKVTNLQIS